MARTKIYKSTLISLYYSFAYPYSIYCSHVWGQNYPSCLERISLIQKKLVRIITCSPFRAHTEPLYFANKILNVSDINDYIIGIFMYECLYGNIPDIFRNFFSEMLMSMIIIFGMQMIYMYHTDDLILENSVSKIAGANLWNFLPSLVKKSQSIHIFRKIWGITWLREKYSFRGLVNPFSSVETCTRQWKKSASALAMACPILGAKPLSEQMLAFYQLDHRTLDQDMKIVIAENGFRNIICKMPSILPKW